MSVGKDTMAGGKTCEERVRLMYGYASQMSEAVSAGQITRELLGTSFFCQLAATKGVELIGEEAWELNKAGFSLGDAIDLRAIGQMRHRMVHHYDAINWSFVEEAVFEDIPELVGLLEESCRELGIELDLEDAEDSEEDNPAE